MQYGAVGKTQLVAAFAEKAEKERWIARKAYWIRMGGNESQAIDSVSEFTEVLSKRQFRKEDRAQLRAIVSRLRSELKSISGRWLLCLDNSDDQSVNHIVGELASIATSSGGWMLVTSRQGPDTLWDEMVEQQNLFLALLHVKQSMVDHVSKKRYVI